jgi:thiol-disulfide isomerase/thioredoxin
MEPVALRLLLVVLVLALVAAVGRWWQRRDGGVRSGADASLRSRHLAAVGLDLAGAEAGAVLLGSPACAPCDHVKRILGELEAERAGFRWTYADAADHLELAEEHRVLRVPTLFLLEPSGRILARSSGVPRTEDLRRILDGTAVDESVA